MVIDSSGTVKDLYNYYAFGAPLAQTVSTDQAYRYTGKPFDEEGGFDLYYYGARYYDGLTGRFLAVDPMADKYPGWSPYVYCLDNPAGLVDPDGQAPGDPFQTQDAAAQDFGSTYNDDSIRKNREYFAAIYMYSQGGQLTYTYETPVVGKPAEVTPYYARDDRQYTAGAHTHAAYDPNYNSNRFSNPGDITYANSTGLDLYVATPNGSLQVYDPNTGITTIINTSMPSDPNDPNRQSAISPTTNTSDDDTRGTLDKIVDFIVNMF